MGNANSLDFWFSKNVIFMFKNIKYLFKKIIFNIFLFYTYFNTDFIKAQKWKKYYFNFRLLIKESTSTHISCLWIFRIFTKNSDTAIGSVLSNNKTELLIWWKMINFSEKLIKIFSIHKRELTKWIEIKSICKGFARYLLCLDTGQNQRIVYTCLKFLMIILLKFNKKIQKDL